MPQHGSLHSAMFSSSFPGSTGVQSQHMTEQLPIVAMSMLAAHPPSCLVLLCPAGGTSRVSLELPCLSEPVVQAMLGPQLLRKASNGKKQLQVRCSQRSDSVLCT